MTYSIPTYLSMITNKPRFEPYSRALTVLCEQVALELVGLAERQVGAAPERALGVRDSQRRLAGDGILGQQHGAEQRLFGLQVVRRHPRRARRSTFNIRSCVRHEAFTLLLRPWGPLEALLVDSPVDAHPHYVDGV